VRSVGVPRFGYCPICGGVGCISCWVFITPWCGMGFCNIAGGGCCTYCCGACWGQAVLGDVVHFRFFHPFKVNNLREMVSIMAILTAKGTREVCPKIVVILPLAFVVISPLGVLVPLILVAPEQVGSVGGGFGSLLVLDYYCFGFFLSFWHCSTDGSDFSYSVVQNFDIVEWERDEQN
jgi:hypothetical protein